MMFFRSIALLISRGAIGVDFALEDGVEGGVVSGDRGVSLCGEIGVGGLVMPGVCWMVCEFSSVLISSFSPSFSTL
jgi:hypothetical protein